MCTLIAIHRRVPGTPLVVAANRDEYFDRPAEGPALRTLGDGRPGPVISPLDLRAGGTWLGLSPGGLFAAVTNLRCASPDPARRSRGLVVFDALREPSASRAADMLKALPEGAYNPFHCFVADAERAFLLAYRERPAVRELVPGAHVIGNVDPQEEPAPKVERVRRGAERASRLARTEVLDALAEICREHESGGGGAADTCVHLPQHGKPEHGKGVYGTRSSLLLTLAEAPEESRLLFADGPPCVTEYEDQTTLLHEQRHEQSQRQCYGAGGAAVRRAS